MQSKLMFDSTGNWRLSSSATVPAKPPAQCKTTTRARKTKQKNKTLPKADVNSSPSPSPSLQVTAASVASLGTILEQSTTTTQVRHPVQHSTALQADAKLSLSAPIQATILEQPRSTAVTPNQSNDAPSVTVASQLPPSSDILSPRSKRRAYRKSYQQNVRNASAATFDLLLTHLSEHYPTAIWEYTTLDPAPKVYRLATATYHLITQLQHQLWPDTFPAHFPPNTLAEKSDNGNAKLNGKAADEEPPSGRTPSGRISQAKTNKGRDKSYDAVERLIEVLDSDLRPKNTQIKGLPDQKAWAPAIVMMSRLERELREEGMVFRGEMDGQMGMEKGKGSSGGKRVGSDMVRNGEVYPPFLGV